MLVSVDPRDKSIAVGRGTRSWLGGLLDRLKFRWRLFPSTRHSLLAGLKTEDREMRGRAFVRLKEAYFEPLHQSLILSGFGEPRSRQLAADFFSFAFTKKFLSKFDPKKAKFRSYLCGCFRNFLKQEFARDRQLIPPPMLQAEPESETALLDRVEENFELSWLHKVLKTALSRLRKLQYESGRTPQVRIRQYRIFEHWLYSLAPDLPSDLASSSEVAERIQGFLGEEVDGRYDKYRLVADLLREPYHIVNSDINKLRPLFRRLVSDVMIEDRADQDDFARLGVPFPGDGR